MNKMHMHTVIARKKQPAIRLRHMDDGPNGHCRQPRPRYVEAKGKFIAENELVNPFAWCGVQRKFPMAQAHTIPREAGVKLNTPNFQVCLQSKESPIKEKIERSDKRRCIEKWKR
jgi:hypothetical protein